MTIIFNYRFSNKNQEVIKPLSITIISGKLDEQHKIKPLA